MHNFRRMIGLLVASTAIVLGLGAGQAHAATEPTDQLATVQCKAINLGANVSNFGVGYAFNSNCSPSHPLVIQVQWIDAVGNVLNDNSAWLPPGQAGVSLTYSGNLQRPQDPGRQCTPVSG